MAPQVADARGHYPSDMRIPHAFLVLLALACQPQAALPDAADGDAAPVAVHVDGIAIDRESGTPVVVLGADEGDELLPIWIGSNEARSIAVALEGARAPRPNTHDLARRLVERRGGAIERVVVTKLERGVYFARIHLTGITDAIDARPSDAIAIALRMDAPLFVVPTLFDGSERGDDEPAQRVHQGGFDEPSVIASIGDGDDRQLGARSR